MSVIINSASADLEKKNAVQELIKLIDEFLNLSQKVEEENIIEWVFYLFEPNGFEVGLSTFQNAAAVGLCVFATDQKLCKEIENIYGDNYTFLCDMLQKIVEFCSRIRDNETNLTRLDKCRWEIGHTSHLTLKHVISEKEKYKYKLNYLKECIEINKSML